MKLFTRLVLWFGLTFSSLLSAAQPYAAYAAGPAAPSQRPASAPSSTIIVNSANDANSRDSELTLREAILIARGDLTLCLTNLERAQIFDATWSPASPDAGNCNDITGGVGKYSSDWIIFSGAVTNISVPSGLPHLFCDDWISSGFGVSRTVTLDGSSAGPADGLTVECPTPNGALGGYAIQYLSVVGFNGNGITVMGAYTGTVKGMVVASTCYSGIVLTSDNTLQRNSRNNVIGGTSATDRNYIFDNGTAGGCGPGDGIQIDGNSGFDNSLMNNQITGNYIGLNTSGTSFGNGRQGIYLQNAWYNAIGGSTAASGNVISNNKNDGIKLEGADANGNGIYNNIIGLNPAATSKMGNVYSGISLLSGAHDNLVGTSLSNRNMIAGNNWGVYIANFGTNSNSLAYNMIGTNGASASGLGNTAAGVGIYDNVAFNDIGTNGANTISGNGIGVEIKDSGTNYNFIANNQIGLNSLGNAALANGTGIKLSGGVHFNDVNANTISGNTTAGVLIDGAGTMTNTLRSNKIGTNITGTAAIPNASLGVKIQNGATANVIGLAAEGNLISGNSGDGVQITGSGTALNMVYANTIGLNASANAKLPNGASGVAVLGGAGANRIGGAGKGNTIAGNGNAGVFIANAGTVSTFVFGNTIGTNSASAGGLGNTNAGVGIYDGALYSFIGETGAVFEGAGNVISGNGGPGIDIANSGTRYSGIYNNKIGTNISGTAPLPNSIGIRLYGQTTQNLLGFVSKGNLISGNAGPGVGLYNAGTATNTVSSNFIGTNLLGTSAISNTMQGVIIQEASASNVITGNVVSGNGADGILIQQAGTDFNVVKNNRIGTNAAGTGAIPNGFSGVVVANGPTGTTIGGATSGDRNLISGNSTNGVYITGSGTTAATVDSNYIGLDSLGTASVPNQGAGIVVIDARGTFIGGSAVPQYIAGNGREGIYIQNAVLTTIGGNNFVGVAANGVSPYGNGLQGIMLSGAISTSVNASIVAYSGGAGIAVVGANAHGNRLTPGTVRSNGGLPIDLGNDGFTPNGLHSPPGPNNWLPYPVITATSGTIITGTACTSCVVLIYQALANPAASGGGGSYASLTVANGAGVWSKDLCCAFTAGGVTLQAWQSGAGNNSSEFSPLYLPYKLFLPLVQK